MTGAATVVTYTVSDANADLLLERIQTRLIPAARDAPGYQGFLVLDQGEGRRMGVVLCDSVESARRIQGIIGPIARDHVYPLMESPSVGTLCVVLAETDSSPPAEAARGKAALRLNPCFGGPH